MANKNKKRSPPQGNIKSWILFTVILVALFSGLIVWQNQREKKEKAPPTETTEVKGPGKPFAKKEELSEKEKARLDQQALYEAWSGSSEEACQTILDPLLLQKCLDTLRFGLFIKGNNEKRCEELMDETLRRQCVDQILFLSATTSLDLLPCQRINDLQLKQNCLDKIQSLLARRGKTISECDAIPNETLKKECQNQVHLNTSVETLDEEGCKAIADAELQNRCTSLVTQNKRVIEQSKENAKRTVQSATELSKKCDTLNEEASGACHDEANFKLALEKKDLSYCQKIEKAQKQNECLELQGSHLNRFYLKQAIAKKDPSLCQKILQEPLKQSCLAYLQKP